MSEDRIFVGFRLAAASRDKVDDLAKQRGTDRSEALRYLLARGWQAHQARPEQPPPLNTPVKQAPVEEPGDFAERYAKLQKGGRR